MRKSLKFSCCQQLSIDEIFYFVNNKERGEVHEKLIGVLVVLGIFLGGSFAAYHYFTAAKLIIQKSRRMAKCQLPKQITERNSRLIPTSKRLIIKMVKKQVTLREEREHPLKMNAYLKLKVNPRKGVLSWEEIKASEVPKMRQKNR